MVVPISLELTPDAALLQPEAEQQFQVTGRLADGTAVTVAAVWTATGGTVTSAGLYHAGTTPGVYRVVAASADNLRADTATVTIEAPTLTAVTSTPASVTLTGGTSQMFTATGQYSDGTAGPVSVTWSATGGAVSSSGLYTAGSAGGTYEVIATSADGSLSDTSVITIQPSGLFVRASGVPTTLEKWLLQNTDTSVAGKKLCPSDAVSNFAALDFEIEDVWPGCPTELSVFATDAAPRLDLAPTPAVIGGKNLMVEPLPARWVVKLRVIYEYSGGDLDAQDGVNTANILFHDNRMGLTLEVPNGPEYISPDPDPTGKVDPIAVAIKGGCQGIVSAGLVASDRISIFLVHEKQWPPDLISDDYGHNCYQKGQPGIVFVRQEHVPKIFAHEIGHALSLDHIHPLVAPNWDMSNLMRGSAFDPGSDSALNSFTLGQAYRANFNKASWLNASKTRVDPTKTCQVAGPTDVPLTWPCPVIFLKW